MAQEEGFCVCSGGIIGMGETAFLSGASASITGNMLTTSGTTIKEDMAMLKRLGLTNREEGNLTTGTCGAHQ